MPAPLDLRTLRAEDRVALDGELADARTRGDLRPSSDPDLAFLPQMIGVQPVPSAPV